MVSDVCVCVCVSDARGRGILCSSESYEHVSVERLLQAHHD